ncbi:hypothetical protein F5884DRAFT_658374 [Xylogone sp. PMI_703]|nr:hypothetical protein F5884DRAFT_658374 [Xylogone sp. PMI_703]
MGTFVFKWAHPADDVYVTGTFDNWSKSEKLVKNGDIFEKTVDLPKADEKIYYKFVVDGEWTTDHTAPQENDASGNLNNILTPERIVKTTPETVGIMSGVTPNATTAELAKDVPLEKPAETSAETSAEKPDETPLAEKDLPGAFPETPAADAEVSVNPIPGTAGAGNPIKLAPGEAVPHHSTFTENTVQSGVHDDPELVAADKKAEAESEQTFSVSPLPAFPGAVNPVQVAPGEPIPHHSTLTSATLDSHVRTDKESYENGGAFEAAPVLPPVVTPETEREKNGTGVLDIPPVTTVITTAESDTHPTIQSAGPQTTTAQLAAAVPLESAKVPEVVKESQQAAGVDPEASANPVEVKEKKEVEAELLSEIPVAPPTSEGTIGGQQSAAIPPAPATSEGTAGEGAATSANAAPLEAEAAAAAGAAALTAAAVEPTVASPAPAPTKVREEPPEVVKESIAESGQSPEAAAYSVPILEKKAVEKELLSEVKPEESAGAPAPVITAETTETAPAPTSTEAAANGTTSTEAATPVTDATKPTEHATGNGVTGNGTTGNGTTGNGTTTGNGAASTNGSDKKKKRLSLFGRIKAKLSHKS